MKAPVEGLEVVIKATPNGDYTVESNSRENYRVLHALKAIVKDMEKAVNAKRGRLLLPASHLDQFTLNGN